MKRYEGLFILETAAKEEGIKDAIDKISAEITTLGGKVETVQKMDKKNYSRVADKKHSAGFYVNIIFEGQPVGVSEWVAGDKIIQRRAGDTWIGELSVPPGDLRIIEIKL